MKIHLFKVFVLLALFINTNVHAEPVAVVSPSAKMLMYIQPIE